VNWAYPAGKDTERGKVSVARWSASTRRKKGSVEGGDVRRAVRLIIKGALWKRGKVYSSPVHLEGKAASACGTLKFSTARGGEKTREGVKRGEGGEGGDRRFSIRVRSSIASRQKGSKQFEYPQTTISCDVRSGIGGCVARDSYEQESARSNQGLSYGFSEKVRPGTRGVAKNKREQFKCYV